ncbi:MAG: transcriptional repressor [Candidatus Omnitrophica bacterium]|nr:transcriptional repressor [Candidatus Omnitrophota bacterium]
MEHYIDKLKHSGLKLTPRRQAIIALFIERKSHLTPEKVWEYLKKKFSRCGLPGVYRNLESLVECGILTRIQQFDSKKHYSLCSIGYGHDHHHFICRKCNKVEEVDFCNFKVISRFIEDNLHAKVEAHQFQIQGLCSKCK